MLDIGPGNVALEESTRTSVAQADWFSVAEAERSQHEGQHDDNLGIHGTGGRQREDRGRTPSCGACGE